MGALTVETELVLPGPDINLCESTPPERDRPTSLRLAVLLAVVLATCSVAGWTLAVQFDPTPPSPGASTTVAAVHVALVVWVPSGCSLGTHSNSGGYYREGSTFNTSTEFVNPNSTSACDLSDPTLLPGSFDVVSSNLPLSLLPGASATVKVEVRIPAYSPPTELEIDLTAELGP